MPNAGPLFKGEQKDVIPFVFDKARKDIAFPLDLSLHVCASLDQVHGNVVGMGINECQVEGLINRKTVLNVDRRIRLDEYLDGFEIHLSYSMDQCSVFVLVQGVQIEATRHKLSQTRVPNAMVRHTIEKLGVHETLL
jgi:hypothetical protein